jgi:hypothetical protein
MTCSSNSSSPLLVWREGAAWTSVEGFDGPVCLRRCPSRPSALARARPITRVRCSVSLHRRRPSGAPSALPPSPTLLAAATGKHRRSSTRSQREATGLPGPRLSSRNLASTTAWPGWANWEACRLAAAK